MDIMLPKFFDSEKILTPDENERFQLVLTHKASDNLVYSGYISFKNKLFDGDKLIINDRDAEPPLFAGECSKFRSYK